MSDIQLYNYRMGKGKRRTLDQVGKKFGLSRERIRQRLHRFCAAHPDLPNAIGRFNYYDYADAYQRDK